MSILDVGALAREDPEGSKDSGVNPLKAPGEGLLVFLMETEEDGLEFGKVFHGEARRSEWLLLAGPAFPHLLMGTYLPINSKVRIASTEDLQAYLLWEAYQVSESQDLRLVRTGQWQQHDAGGPFARSSSDEGETGHERVFSGSSDGGARQGNMTEIFARSDSADALNYQHGDAAETSEYQSQPNIMELRTVIDARANPGTIAPRFDFYSSDSLYNHGSTAFRIQMNTLTELSHSRGSNDSDTRRSRSQRSHNTAKERANTSGARAQPNSNHEAEPQPDLSNSLSQTAFLKRNKPQQNPPDAAPPNKQIILANRRFQKRNKIDPESITRAVNITELPEGRRVTKMMRFGSLEAPVDDPLQRRGDLTGLHLRCTIIELHLLPCQGRRLGVKGRWPVERDGRRGQAGRGRHRGGGAGHHARMKHRSRLPSRCFVRKVQDRDPAAIFGRLRVDGLYDAVRFERVGRGFGGAGRPGGGAVRGLSLVRSRGHAVCSRHG